MDTFNNSADRLDADGRSVYRLSGQSQILPRMNPESPFASSATPGGEVVVPVSALNRAIGTMLERSFPLVWVSGEVSNFTRAAKGTAANACGSSI